MDETARVDELLGQAAPERVKYPGISRVRYSHDAMIDIIVENPWVSQNELAATFGYTPAWVSIVMSSDAFRARLEARRTELIDPAIRASLEERFRALATRSLEVLQAKLAKNPEAIPDALALKAAELGAKALGMGQAPAAPPQIDSSERLARLAERLLSLQSSPRLSPYLEAEVINVQTS